MWYQQKCKENLCSFRVPKNDFAEFYEDFLSNYDMKALLINAY